MCDIRLYVLEDVIGLRIDLTQKDLGLFVHNRVEFPQTTVAEILMKSATVLPPHGAVGHQTKAPSKVHPSCNSIATMEAH